MRLGVMFDRDLPPERLVPFAQALDSRIDDVWVVEDLGWTGGLSSAAAALAATSRVRVGLGIAPAPLRNPMLLAMEFANLARLFPGRFVGGIGHGVQEWMRQVGAAAPSPLTLLEETITSVRGLLRGESVTMDGRAVHLDAVRLVHPPAVAPPVVAGVKGPRSLAMSGRVAQGTILPEGFGPDAIGPALERISASGEHELIVFTLLCVGDPSGLERMRAGAAEFLGVGPSEVFAAEGSPAQAAEAVKALWAAGVNTVVLRPVGDDPLSHVEQLLSAL
ncbi:LLM class flavin-dependent oxidoreductase [Nonomuraea sp. NPDC059194]|uniref:LLM class flavin-dependent oxidoreductase n=1 Tax=Nonomuraea sp. NPDC059194 TaxID=3346764 RepID=UPI003675E013